ncbi:hypothetical protein, partial [Coleofasciculus sp.]|uniref:hypothetical protein n=1 Tax=Coleofasciculus sp. TaxID=3100458 RepID=UPI003A1CE8D6
PLLGYQAPTWLPSPYIFIRGDESGHHIISWGIQKPETGCPILSYHAFKLGIGSEQYAKPAAWLR